MSPNISATKFQTTRVLAALTVSLALTLAACGGDGAGVNGTLRVSLTDAPACGYDAVNVTITDVSVNQSSSAAIGDAGWVHVPIAPKKINLLDLQNGILATLGQTPLTAGRYTQMRLLLASNTGATFANSVLPTGGAETALTTPSGLQTGVKMNVDINIVADQMADVVIDFHVCKSVVRAGASQYLLKPVLAVTPNYISGAKGTVDASIAGGTGANTLVMLQQPGSATQAPVIVRATTPDASGNYLLQPVAPGTYNLVVTSNGRATAVVTGVVVQNQLLATIPGAINPPASAAGTQGGTVTSAVTPIDASLTAQQALSAGGTIEVAYTAADAITGSYSLALPVGAPMVAPYASGTLTFSADNGAAGKYTIAATSGGVTTLSGPLTITTGSNAAVNFAF